MIKRNITEIEEYFKKEYHQIQQMTEMWKHVERIHEEKYPILRSLLSSKLKMNNTLDETISAVEKDIQDISFTEENCSSKNPNLCNRPSTSRDSRFSKKISYVDSSLTPTPSNIFEQLPLDIQNCGLNFKKQVLSGKLTIQLKNTGQNFPVLPENKDIKTIRNKVDVTLFTSESDDNSETMTWKIIKNCQENKSLVLKIKRKKFIETISKRQIDFGYAAINKNDRGEIDTFSLGTFTNLVTIKNCDKKFSKKMKLYKKKFNLKTIFMLKDKNLKIKKNKIGIKYFNLNKIYKCIKCKKSSCTAGKVSFYFKHFHGITFTDCDFK